MNKKSNDDCRDVACNVSTNPEPETRNPEQNGLYSGPGVIRTFTGIFIDVLNPKPEQICIDDIAHALSNQCRFGGHTLQFYSVAEHSLHVAEMVPDKQRLAALLHDASEAYLVDIPSPVKQLMPQYYEAEYKLMEVIAEKFGFEYPLHEHVADADIAALEAEWSLLMVGSGKYQPRTSIQARLDFLVAFDLFNI